MEEVPSLQRRTLSLGLCTALAGALSRQARQRRRAAGGGVHTPRHIVLSHCGARNHHGRRVLDLHLAQQHIPVLRRRDDE
jgi:hypothetical protein